MKDESNKKFLVTELEDIIYNPANVVWGALHRNTYGKGCLSPIYKIFSTYENPAFIECILRSPSFIRALSQKTEGTVVKLKTLKPEAFLEMSISVAPQRAEQDAIAAVFEQIDNLITLHQCKYYHLRTSDSNKKTELLLLHNTATWEQRKVNEIGVVIDPHPSHRAPPEEIGGIPFIGIGDVDEMGNINRESARPVSASVYDEHHRRYDLRIPSLGLGRVASLGKVIRLRADIGKYAISPTMSVLQFNDEVDIDYLYAFMNSSGFVKQFKGKSNGSTRQSVGTEMVRLLDLQLPHQIDEQKRIGELFRNMDNLITLHQRKCDELKIYKKGLLQQMFPQPGDAFPRVRFPGFTDPWEQRKLSDISELITVGIANSATHAYSENGVVMFRNQNIKANYLDDTDLIHINESFEKKYVKKRLRANDLLIARTGYPGTACVVPAKYEGSQTFTTLIARLKEGEVNPYFVCQYINSDIGKNYFESTQIGGGQKNSGAGILEKMPIQLPLSLAEQSQIADFMSLIDNAITLHQRKCDELKSYKKGLLQKMFV